MRYLRLTKGKMVKAERPLEINEINPLSEDFSLYHYLLGKEKNNTFAQLITAPKKIPLSLPENTGSQVAEIVQGAIKVIHLSEEGDTAISEVLLKGQFFTNLSVMQQEWCEYLVPMVDSRIRVYHPPFFKHQITTDPVAAEWFYALTSNSKSILKNRLIQLTTTTVRSKVDFVKKTLDDTVVDIYGKSWLLIDLLSLSEIARFAGITRQTAAQFLQTKRKEKLRPKAKMT